VRHISDLRSDLSGSNYDPVGQDRGVIV